MQIAFPLEIVLHIVLEERGVRALQRRVRRIEFLVLAGRVGVEPGEPAVEAAEHQPLVAQQFLAEASGIDAQIRFENELR